MAFDSQLRYPKEHPGYAGPSLLVPELTHSPRHGYAILASPVTAAQTGVRAFCADSSGTICAALQ